MGTNYTDFRRALDNVLSTRDPQMLRAFLIEHGQWEPDTTQNAEDYMWMMIAGSTALVSLHPQADAWLQAHGRAEEGEEIASRRKGAAPRKPAAPKAPKAPKPPKPPQP